jgi:hypothetical protein
MSKLTDFTVTSAEKDDFYGFHRVAPNQTIHRTVTLVTGNESVYEYTLGTGFDISTLAYSTSYYVGFNDSNPLNTTFSTDGTKMYIMGNADKHVDEYTLTTAFDISTASWRTHKDVSAQDDNPRSVRFNPDGTKMYVVGRDGVASAGIAANNINEYALSTAWDITTATYTDLFSCNAQDTAISDMQFNADGTLLIVLGDTGNDVNEYDLATAYDVSTATFVDAFSIGAQETSPTGLFFNALGTRMYVAGTDGDDVIQYPLVTGFDVSTIQALTHEVILTGAPSAPTMNPRGLTFNADGTKLYVLGTAGTLMIDAGSDELPYNHVARSQNTMKFLEGNTYVFDVSQAALDGHTIKFSTTVDGTHKAGGTEYITNVSSAGAAGTAGATTTIIVPSKTPSTDPGSAIAKLYYYNGSHPSQGGEINTPEWKGNLQITYTNGLDNIDTRYKTQNQEDIFEDSILWKRGLAWTIVDGNLTVELG